MRTRILIVAAASLLLAICSVAQAGPARVTFISDEHLQVPFCGFPVQVDVEGRLAAILFTDDEGNLVRTIEPAAGPVRATLNNLDTGKVVTLHPSGPGQLRSLPDGFSFTTYGPWLSFLRPTDGLEGIWLVRGNQTKTFTAEDFTWDFHGTVVDLCAKLAAS